MKTFRNLCTTAVLLAALGLGAAGTTARAAQTVSPVSSQTSLVAPYIYRLQDWSNLPAHRLQLRIRLLDTRVSSTTLYLKMELESKGLKAENPYPLPIGIALAGGEEKVLDATQLGIYFLPSNLSLSGSKMAEVQTSNGILPDGLYSLRFKVYEATSGRQVSIQEIPAMFNLVSGDPPLITFPGDGATLLYTDPCHIRFQWMPRHLQYAGGFETEYTFELAEIPQGVQTWKEYFQTLSSVYKTTTTNTFVDYGPEMPSLLPEKNYAVRIKAECRNVSGEELYIRNGGYSQVQNFFYHEICPTAGSLRVENIRATAASVSWNEPASAQHCQIYYRKNGKPDALWHKAGEELDAGVGTFRFEGLTPSTGYECKISMHCAYTHSEDDLIVRFTTLGNDNASLDCGHHNLTSDDTRDQTPLEELRPFDQIRTAGGFLIDVEEVETQHGNGVFSGSGNTHIPLLANTGVRIKFKNVFINRNYELVSGTIKAESTISGL